MLKAKSPRPTKEDTRRRTRSVQSREQIKDNQPTEPNIDISDRVTDSYHARQLSSSKREVIHELETLASVEAPSMAPPPLRRDKSDVVAEEMPTPQAIIDALRKAKEDLQKLALSREDMRGVENAFIDLRKELYEAEDRGRGKV